MTQGAVRTAVRVGVTATLTTTVTVTVTATVTIGRYVCAGEGRVLYCCIVRGGDTRYERRSDSVVRRGCKIVRE